MKVITYGVIDWTSLEIEHDLEESYEYEGPVAQCGMILGGALAAGGAGANASITQSLKEMRDEAITRLQNNYAAERQQTEIGAAAGRQQTEIQAQAASQGRSEAFQHGETVSSQAVAAKAAQAHNEFLLMLKNLEVQGKHKDIADLIAGRITVQDLRNQGNVATANARNTSKQQGEYKPGKATLNSPGSDPLGQPIPGKEVDVMIHRDGSKWIQGPGGMYRFDPTQPSGYADPKSYGRPNAQDTNTLLQNPLGTLPSGLSIRDYYANKFGKLPDGYLQAAEAARAKMNAAQAPAPGASNTSGGSSTSTNAPTTNQQLTDTEDQQDNDYAMFGDRGHQPDDDEPAQ